MIKWLINEGDFCLINKMPIYYLYPLLLTPTQLSFQIISFCYIVHAMKIYLNRKQNSARVISVFLLQSFRIEYKLLCKKKFTSLSHLNEVIFSCIYFYMFNVLPPFPLPYLLSLKPYFLDLSTNLQIFNRHF